MQLFLMLLLHIIECLKMMNTLLLAIVVMTFLNLAFNHTNLKTWLAKAKWGITHGLRLLDRKVLALVDNRDK